MRPLIIHPAYNEKENLRTLLPKDFQALPNTEILIVDDNSPDKTADFIYQLKQQDSRIHIINRKKKLGLGSAYIEGFSWALERGYDVIFQMDADHSHPPETLPKMMESIKTSDLVLGSRYIPTGGIKNWSPWRHALSRYGNRYAKFLLKLPYGDLTGGFKCFRRGVLEKLDFTQIRSKDAYSFQLEVTYLAHKLGFKISEIPFVFTERTHGISKITKTPKLALEALINVHRLRQIQRI